jgi:hypothetical protein
MGWNRVEGPKPQTLGRIRGFMSFTEGSNVEGELVGDRFKPDGRGFYILRATKSATVNVQDADSKTGQGKAQIGELIGVRKTGATKILSDIKLGTLVSVTYVALTERVGINPKTKLEENNPYHNITVDVYQPEGEQG